MACSLELTVSANLHTVLVLPVYNITNITLSSLKQVLAEVKHSCPIQFDLLHSHLFLETKGVLAALGGWDSTKVPVIDSLHLEKNL